MQFFFNRTFAGQSPLEMIRTCSDHHWSSDFLGILPIPNGVHSEERRSLRSETPVLSPTSMPDGIDNGGISLLDDGRETLLKQRNPSSSGGEKVTTYYVGILLQKKVAEERCKRF